MIPKSIPAKLPGFLTTQYVTCGNPNCKCTRGERHGPYWYRFWYDHDRRQRKEYVRKGDLVAVQAAIAAQQAEDRAARQLLQKGRLLVNWMEKGDRRRLKTPEDFARTAGSYQVVEELIDLGRGRSSDNLFFQDPLDQPPVARHAYAGRSGYAAGQ